MITLTDCITLVELGTAWGSAGTETKIADIVQTINNTQFEYQWGFLNGFSAIVENENIENIKQINSWWKDNTELFVSYRDYTEAFVVGDPHWGVLGQPYNPLGFALVGSGSPVFISNPEQPFQSMKRPYNNEADGTINLEFI